LEDVAQNHKAETLDKLQTEINLAPNQIEVMVAVN